MTPLARHKWLAAAGFRPPLPTVAQQRAWAYIDDRVPPEGDPDGQFQSHLEWVHKASSWIGYTGAKCFDALNRPCRNGGDMQRAKDENAFPVRWYWPDRFPAQKPMAPRLFQLLQTLNSAGDAGAKAETIRIEAKLKTLRSIPLATAMSAGLVSDQPDLTFRITELGRETYLEERRRQIQASYVRRQ